MLSAAVAKAEEEEEEEEETKFTDRFVHSGSD